VSIFLFFSPSSRDVHGRRPLALPHRKPATGCAQRRCHFHFRDALPDSYERPPQSTITAVFIRFDRRRHVYRLSASIPNNDASKFDYRATRPNQLFCIIFVESPPSPPPSIHPRETLDWRRGRAGYSCEESATMHPRSWAYKPRNDLQLGPIHTQTESTTNRVKPITASKPH